MNIKDIVPVNTLAMKYGVKAVIYGPPGSGKTPLVETAPRPLMLVCEPGMMSLRKSKVPAYLANTHGRIEGFFKWFFGSTEANQFDTLFIDSGSQLAEIVLSDVFGSFKDGRKVYGEMSRICMEWFDPLFYMPNKHIIILAKEVSEEYTVTGNVNGIPTLTTYKFKKPFFPGQDLPMKIAHRYDMIWRANREVIQGAKQTVIYCQPTDAFIARDRSGQLADKEPGNLSYLFQKAMD